MFDLDFDPEYGKLVNLAPGVQRLTARNAGPYTFRGTNSFLIGDREVAVVDPGPGDDQHLADLLRQIGDRTVTHILLTHTHHDHSQLARRLARATGAPVLAWSDGQKLPRQPDGTPADDGEDREFRADDYFRDGDRIAGAGWVLEVIHTPGHASNHVAFALEGTGLALSGDHVMAWSSTVIAPPDGSVAQYLHSIEKLAEREFRTLLPGHGGPVKDPAAFLDHLVRHRKKRSDAILDRLAKGDRQVPEIVAQLYRGIDPRLRSGASLLVLAHLEDFIDQGIVRCDGTPTLSAQYWLA